MTYRKYDHIIIDGNFQSRRLFATHKHMKATVDGEPVHTGLTHGFVRMLCNLRREYKGRVTVVWDSGHVRRKKIDGRYKEKRSRKHWDDYDLFIEHMKLLKWFLSLVGVRQARKKGLLSAPEAARWFDVARETTVKKRIAQVFINSPLSSNS